MTTQTLKIHFNPWTDYVYEQEDGDVVWENEELAGWFEKQYCRPVRKIYILDCGILEPCLSVEFELFPWEEQGCSEHYVVDPFICTDDEFLQLFRLRVL